MGVSMNLSTFYDGPLTPPDNINNPAHYTTGGIECIDVIDQLTKELTGNEAFYIANILKYLWRWKNKNGVEDLKKARFYLDRLIDKLSS